MNNQEYVTVDEAAKLVNKSKRTIYRWIGSGLLSSKRFTSTGAHYILITDLPTYLRKE